MSPAGYSLAVLSSNRLRFADCLQWWGSFRLRSTGKTSRPSAGGRRCCRQNRQKCGRFIPALTGKGVGLRRIAVNVVAPGPVETDFSGGIVRDNPAVNKMIAENTALGRAGLPEDLGPMIASLLSDNYQMSGAKGSRPGLDQLIA